ncbi:MAG: TolC family protein, partial [Planctomycetota bacterium]|nr:TolC family protein [Planctomycetota bacterium]
YAEASVVGHDKVLDATRKLYKLDAATRPDVNRIAIQRRNAALGLDDARTRLQKSRAYLATLLNLPDDQANRLELRGVIQDVAPPPPDLATLTRLAIAERPDVVAHRLGVTRADNDVILARRNAYPDMFLLYQPYTFQNNAPFGLKSSTSWDLGVTATMPVFNRNQGGIERARLNVAQTGTQLADMERLAAVEVETAYREYALTRRLIAEIKEFTLPEAARLRDDTFQLFTRGELNVLNYLDAEREYNVAVKFYLDTLIRHRLAMLALDTAVGARILP